MTWRELLAQGSGMLQASGIEDAGLDAWYLLEMLSHMSRAEYLLHQQEEAVPDICARYMALIDRRRQHVPLQHLTGVQEFMGLEFQVSPDVLIPRQDTELLVETALPLVQGKRVLDLCTGSGCIAISLAKLGKPERTDAIDLSGKALELARANAQRLHADVTFWNSNLFENVDSTYDVIVSNPPYINSHVVDTLMPEVREHEPRMALDGGEDGLSFYRRIVSAAGTYLQKNGWLALEIGYDQGSAVCGLLREQGFCSVMCQKDLCGNDRVVSGQYSLHKTQRR